MKRLITLLIICFVAGNVFGTESRINGLGVETWMVDDDTNIWFSPAQVTRYPDRLIGEAGTYPAGALPTVGPINIFPGGAAGAGISNQWGGATYAAKIRYPSVIGLFVARPYVGDSDLLNQVGTDAPNSDLDTGGPTDLTNLLVVPSTEGDLRALTPENKYDLLYGLKYSKDLRIGVRVNSASDNEAFEDLRTSDPAVAGDGTVENDQRSSSELNVSVGFLFNRIMVFDRLDATAILSMPSVKNTYQSRVIDTLPPPSTLYQTDDRELKTEGKQNISYAIRGMNRLDNKTKLFTYLQMDNVDLSNTYTDKQDTDADGLLDINVLETRTYKYSSLQIGACLNMQTSEKTLVILGARMENKTITRKKLNGVKLIKVILLCSLRHITGKRLPLKFRSMWL